MKPSWHQQAIALSGTIGSGKSSAACMFAGLGAYVVSADALAREAVEKGSSCLKEIESTFGSEFIDSTGALDREALAKLIFSDSSKREKLEAITHPEIRRRAACAFEKAIADGKSPLIYDCPLLFEAGLEELGFKKIIIVAAEDKHCIERMVARDGLSEEEARKRLAAQIPISSKQERADIVIENNGSLEELEAKVASVYQQIQN